MPWQNQCCFSGKSVLDQCCPCSTGTTTDYSLMIVEMRRYPLQKSVQWNEKQCCGISAASLLLLPPFQPLTTRASLPQQIPTALLTLPDLAGCQLPSSPLSSKPCSACRLPLPPAGCRPYFSSSSEESSRLGGPLPSSPSSPEPCSACPRCALAMHDQAPFSAAIPLSAHCPLSAPLPHSAHDLLRVTKSHAH